jgi:hypothetical protein
MAPGLAPLFWRGTDEVNSNAMLQMPKLGGVTSMNVSIIEACAPAIALSAMVCFVAGVNLVSEVDTSIEPS